MSLDVYYFSGTGNSLAVAREIAQKTKGNLINIASVVDKESVKTDADVIGIVFPVHYLFNGGVPSIVERFVRKLQNMDKKYIFAVCTYGSRAGDTVKKLDKIIKSCDGKLAAGFTVKMPYNYTYWFGKLLEVPIEEQQKDFRNCKKKLESVYEYVNAKKEGKFETDDKIIVLSVDYFGLSKLGKSLYQKKASFVKRNDLPFREILPLMDRSFHYDEKCSGCGICSRVCPVSNIEMVDNKPSWQHHCEQCFACLQWCPKEAIQYGGKTSNGKRYHHPDVAISDMMRHN